MAEDLIQNYIDRAAFEADTKFGIEQLGLLEAAYKRLKELRVDLKIATGLKDISSAATAATLSINDTTSAIAKQKTTLGQAVQGQSAMADSSKALQKEQEKLNALHTEEAKKIAELKVQQQAQSKANKETAIETLGLTDAYQRLNKEYLDTAKSAKALQTQAILNPAFKAEADAASAKAKGLTDTLKSIDAGVGQFQRNVGNYTGAFSILQKGLAQAKEKYDGLSASQKVNSAEGQNLQKTIGILGTVANQQAKGFTSLTTELRSSERALKTLYEAGQAGTPTFKKLQTVVNDTTRDVREFTRQQTLLSSESPALAGLTATARGLGGAYAVGAGAASLFGDENGKVEKELAKLIAIMTLLNGLTEFNRFLQEKGAIATAISGVKTAFLAAAQKLAALATGEASIAMAAEAVTAQAADVAVGKLGVAEKGAAVAGEALTISSTQAGAALGIEAVNTVGLETGLIGVAGAETGAAVAGEALTISSTQAGAALEIEAVNTVGLETGLIGVAGAEAGVAVGATSMATAIAATGIGLLIVGLAIAVFKIVEALKDWNAATASTEKANEALANSVKDLIEAIKSYDDINRKSTERQLEGLDKIIAKRKALGVNTLEGLALDKKSADEKTKATADEVAANQITLEGIKKKEIAALIAAGNVRAAEEVKNKYITDTQHKQDKNFDDVIKNQDLAIKGQKEIYDAASASYDRDVSLFKAAEDTKQQSELLTNQVQKLNADDRRKFILESARIDIDIQKSKNDEVLNNDKSTLQQRLSALSSNLTEQRRLINAENASVQSDPTVSKIDKRLSTQKTSASLDTLERESSIALEKLKEDFRLRDLAATTEAEKKIFEVISQTNQNIYNNDALTESERLESLKTSSLARKAIIDADFKNNLSTAGIGNADIERIKQEGFFEISNKKLTNQELKKLISDYDAAQVALALSTSTDRIKIVKDYYQQEQELRDKNLLSIQRAADLSVEDKTDTYNNQIISLNNSFKAGLLSTTEYNEKRKKLDKQLAIDLLKIEIDRIEKSLDLEVKLNEAIRARLLVEQDQIKNFTGPQTDAEKLVHAERLLRIKEELKATEGVIKKETDLYKGLSKAKKEISDASVNDGKEKFDKAIKVLESFKEKISKVFDVINGAINASATAQKNRLQDQANAIDKNTKVEIDAVNASVLSEQDKAARITIINARAQAQKEEIALRQKKIDQDAAKSQKAFAIFQIILNTAIAITNALKEQNIPLAIFLGILGAAQLAVAIATPIPKFKGGKNNDYAGPAIVGDGGVPEYIKHADGSIQRTPAHDTLVNVGKHDIIYPNFDAMMRSLAMPAITGLPADNMTQQIGSFAERVEHAVKMQTPLLQTIANKKELSLGADNSGMTAIHRWGSRQVKYIDETTNW